MLRRFEEFVGEIWGYEKAEQGPSEGGENQERSLNAGASG
jgi:hypothetical protein